MRFVLIAALFLSACAPLRPGPGIPDTAWRGCVTNEHAPGTKGGECDRVGNVGVQPTPQLPTPPSPPKPDPKPPKDPPHHGGKKKWHGG